MGASIGGLGGEVKRRDGLVEGHAYSLIRAVSVELPNAEPLRLLQLRNPWGNQQVGRDPSSSQAHSLNRVAVNLPNTPLSTLILSVIFCPLVLSYPPLYGLLLPPILFFYLTQSTSSLGVFILPFIAFSSLSRSMEIYVHLLSPEFAISFVTQVLAKIVFLAARIKLAPLVLLLPPVLLVPLLPLVPHY